MPLRPFLPDVTQLTHHQHDDGMPDSFLFGVCLFECAKKVIFCVSKSDKKTIEKATKKRQNTDKHPNKNRELEKSDSCRYFFWPVGSTPD